MVMLTIYERPNLKPKSATPLDLFLDQCLYLVYTVYRDNILLMYDNECVHPGSIHMHQQNHSNIISYYTISTAFAFLV